jgi:Zn-dependent protease with chaperone function
MTMKRIILSFLLSSSIFCGYAQVQEIKNNAKIIQFDPPYEKIKLDILDDDASFIKEFPITSATTILNKKGETVSRDLLKPGNEILITGTKQGYKTTITQINITNTREGSKVNVKGKLEQYNSSRDFAVIDGHKVKLESNVKIIGKNELKNQTFPSFKDITPGYFIDATGIRKQDGLVYATEAYLRPDNFNENEYRLRTSMNADFSSSLMKTVIASGEVKTLTDSVSSGKLKFGDMIYDIHPSAMVQAYVSSIGNKLVPFYQREIPFDVPEKLHFKFIVIDNPMINIAALPNGMVIVNSGILKLLDNESQLAALLGHEIAHCVYKHAVERYENREREKKIKETGKEVKDIVSPFISEYTRGNETLENINQNLKYVEEKIGTLPPETQAAIRNLLKSVSGLLDNNFSKLLEEQADRVGIFYMYEAGYNPFDAVNVWEKFMNLSKDVNKMAEINKLTQNWMMAKERYAYSNPLAGIGDVLAARIIQVLTDNNFTDHPKATKRFRLVNQLVSESYIPADLQGKISDSPLFAEMQKQLMTTK